MGHWNGGVQVGLDPPRTLCLCNDENVTAMIIHMTYPNTLWRRV